MLQFIRRTVKVNEGRIILYQACACHRGRPIWYDGQELPFTDGNCKFCLYRSTWTKFAEFQDCYAKHKCVMAAFPFVKMARAFNEAGTWGGEDPDEGDFSYEPTGQFKQVKFEGMPLYAQLYNITDLDDIYAPRCNAYCYYHDWRMNNKKTWRQCGEAHICGNNGSLWLLMLPTDNSLFQEFSNQF